MSLRDKTFNVVVFDIMRGNDKKKGRSLLKDIESIVIHYLECSKCYKMSTLPSPKPYGSLCYLCEKRWIFCTACDSCHRRRRYGSSFYGWHVFCGIYNIQLGIDIYKDEIMYPGANPRKYTLASYNRTFTGYDPKDTY